MPKKPKSHEETTYEDLRATIEDCVGTLPESAQRDVLDRLAADIEGWLDGLPASGGAPDGI